jgi:hypothetical protein
MELVPAVCTLNEEEVGFGHVVVPIENHSGNQGACTLLQMSFQMIFFVIVVH